jgi:hypothetical protein
VSQLSSPQSDPSSLPEMHDNGRPSNWRGAIDAIDMISATTAIFNGARGF